ncbi:MAG: ATP-grasp domain-containing protein, partial [Candidatus Kerfeldbacteria bacterium]|nr:ATP-grasp domain-containing protein [Candidatus Kerfeldbacteria bacterium]
MQRTIAILSGGTSTERDIALASAASVANALTGVARTELFDFPTALDDFLRRRSTFDCVIPVFHGRGGEDGTIQGFLETLGMPYIFSDTHAQSTAIDKFLSSTLARTMGVRIPDQIVIDGNAPLKFTAPVVVKPIDGGSSVGVGIAHSAGELTTLIVGARQVSSRVLIEQYIRGAEYSVAVIAVAGEIIPLPVISIHPHHEFFDYDGKYTDGMAEERCPADIPEALATQLQGDAVTVHRALGARHVTRSDFIVDPAGQS